MNLTGGGGLKALTIPKEGIKVKSERLPGGEGTLRQDGVLVDKNGKEFAPGTRENTISENSQDVPARKKPDTDPTSQHNEKNMSDAKARLGNKLLMGAMLIPALLPLALMLAGMIQGGIACKQLDEKEFKIESAVSAKTPNYPDSTPDWIKNNLVYNKTKVNLTFSPCVHILKTDSIKVHDSNVFDGTYDITRVNGSCSIRVDIGSEYATANTFSNTAGFTLYTSCEDRMAYAVGEDAQILAEGAGSMLSGFLGSFDFSTIFLILGLVVAVWFVFQAVQIFKKS